MSTNSYGSGRNRMMNESCVLIYTFKYTTIDFGVISGAGRPTTVKTLKNAGGSGGAAAMESARSNPHIPGNREFRSYRALICLQAHRRVNDFVRIQVRTFTKPRKVIRERGM